MRIGLDFDNTIVNYDKIFYDVAIEWDIVPKDIPTNKLAVRNFLREQGKEERWTEMQGYVYGARMDDAQLYPGVIDFIKEVKKNGHAIAIVSHKTRHPFLGPKYDLHDAARQWIEKNLRSDGVLLLEEGSVFFELTKETKLKRIGDLCCDVFVDDLPEIIASSYFPANTSAILFDPDLTHVPITEKYPGLCVLSSWAEIQKKLGF